MSPFFKRLNPDVEAGKARKALAEGRPEEAAEACEAALKAAPDHAECRTLLARAYEKQGRVADAIEAYEAACEKAPSYPNLKAAADLYVRVGDWEHAEEKFQAAVATFPTSVPAWRGLAEVRKKLGKHDETVRCYEMIASLRPDNVDARLDLAEAYRETGAVRRATELGRGILESEPQNPRALHCLANCQAALHEWDQAIGLYERLLALPEDEAVDRARVHYDFGVALREVDRCDEARAHLEACRELQPNFLPAYRALAELCRSMDDLTSAVAVTERAARLAPSEVAIWNELGALHLAAGDAKAALRAYSTAHKIEADNVEAIAGGAEALSALGQHGRAKTICDRLVVSRAFQARPHLAYARVMRNAGALDVALHQVDIALAIDAGSREAQRLHRALAKALGVD